MTTTNENVERCVKCGLPLDPARPPHATPAILSKRWGGCHACNAPDPAHGIVPHEPKCHPYVPAPAKGEVGGEERDAYGFHPLAWQLLDSLMDGHHWRGKQEEAHAILADFTRILSPLPSPKGMEEPWEDDAMRRQTVRIVASVASDLWGCQSRDATSVVDSRALDAAVTLLREYANVLASSPSPAETQATGKQSLQVAETPAERARREAHEALDNFIEVVADLEPFVEAWPITLPTDHPLCIAIHAAARTKE